MKVTIVLLIFLAISVKIASTKFPSFLPDYGGCNALAHGKAVVEVLKCVKGQTGFGFILKTPKQKAKKICQKKVQMISCFDTLINLPCWTTEESERWKIGIQAFDRGVTYLCSKNLKHVKDFFKANGFWCLTGNLLSILGCKPFGLLTRASLHSKSSSEAICSTGDCLKGVFEKCSKKASKIASNTIQIVKSGLNCDGTTEIKNISSLAIVDHGVAGNCTTQYLDALTSFRTCISSKYTQRFRIGILKGRAIATCSKRANLLGCANRLINLKCWTPDEKRRWQDSVNSIKSAFSVLCSNRHRNINLFFQSYGQACIKKRLPALKGCISDDFFNSTSLHSNQTIGPLCSAGDCVKSVVADCTPRASRLVAKLINNVQIGIQCPQSASMNVSTDLTPDKTGEPKGYGNCKREHYIKSQAEIRRCISRLYAYKFKINIFKMQSATTCRKRENVFGCLQSVTRMPCLESEEKNSLLKTISSFKEGFKFVCEHGHKYLKKFFRFYGFNCIKKHLKDLKNCIPETLLNGTYFYTNSSKETICSVGDCLQSIFQDCTPRVSKITGRAFGIVQTKLGCAHAAQNTSVELNLGNVTETFGNCSKTEYTGAVEKVKSCISGLFQYKFRFQRLKQRSMLSCRKKEMIIGCSRHILNLGCWSPEEKQRWENAVASIRKSAEYLCSNKHSNLNKFFRNYGFLCIKRRYSLLEQCLPEYILKSASLHSNESTAMVCSVGDCVKASIDDCGRRASQIGWNAINIAQIGLNCPNVNNTVANNTGDANELVGNCKQGDYQTAVSEMKTCIASKFIYKLKVKNFKFQSHTACRKRTAIFACTRKVTDLSCWTSLQKQNWNVFISSIKTIFNLLCPNQHKQLKRYFRAYGFYCIKSHASNMETCISEIIHPGLRSMHSQNALESVCSAGDCVKTVFQDCSRHASIIGITAINRMQTRLNCSGTILAATDLNAIKKSSEELIGNCKKSEYNSAMKKTKECIKKTFKRQFNIYTLKYYFSWSCSKSKAIEKCVSHVTKLSCWKGQEKARWLKAATTTKATIKLMCARNNRYIKYFFKNNGLYCLHQKWDSVKQCLSPEMLDGISLHSAASTADICSASECLRTVLKTCPVKVAAISGRIIDVVESGLGCEDVKPSNITEDDLDKILEKKPEKIGSCKVETYNIAVNKMKDCISNNFKHTFRLAIMRNRMFVTCKKKENVLKCSEHVINLSCWNQEEKENWNNAVSGFRNALNFLCANQRNQIKNYFRAYGFYCIKKRRSLLKNCMNYDSLMDYSFHSNYSTEIACNAGNCVKYIINNCVPKAKAIAKRAINIIQSNLKCPGSSSVDISSRIPSGRQPTGDQYIGGCKKQVYIRAKSRMRVCISNVFKYKFKFFNLRHRAYASCRKNKKILACTNEVIKLSCWKPAEKKKWVKTVNSFRIVSNMICSKKRRLLRFFFRRRGFLCIKKNLPALKNCIPENILKGVSVQTEESRSELCSAGDCIKTVFGGCSKTVSKITNKVIENLQSGLECEEVESIKIDPDIQIDELRMEEQVVGSCKMPVYVEAVTKTKECVSNLFKYKFKLGLMKYRASAICQNREKIFSCSSFIMDLDCWNPAEKTKWQTGLNAFKNAVNLICSNDKKVMNAFFEYQGFYCLKNGVSFFESCKPYDLFTGGASLHSSPSTEEICSAADCVKSVIEDCNKDASLIGLTVINKLKSELQCEGAKADNTSLSQIIDEKSSLQGRTIRGCKKQDYEEATEKAKTCIYDIIGNITDLSSAINVGCSNKDQMIGCIEDIVNLTCWSTKQREAWSRAINVFQASAKLVCSNKQITVKSLACAENHTDLVDSCLPDGSITKLSFATDQQLTIACSAGDCLKGFAEICGNKTVDYAHSLFDKMQTDLKCSNVIPDNHLLAAQKLQNEKYVGSCSQTDYSEAVSKVKDCVTALYSQECMVSDFKDKISAICRRRMGVGKCTEHIVTLSCWDSKERSYWKQSLNALNEALEWQCGNYNRHLKEFAADGGFDCINDQSLKLQGCIDSNLNALTSLHSKESSTSFCTFGDCLKSLFKDCNPNIKTEFISLVQTRLQCQIDNHSSRVSAGSVLSYTNFVIIITIIKNYFLGIRL